MSTSAASASPEAAAEAPSDAAQQRLQRMLNARPLPLLLAMASPNALAFFVQASVSMTEVWYIGQLGTVSLAAIALMFPWLMLMQMLANGAIGGAVTGAIARTLGAGGSVQAERLIWHSIVIALTTGGLFMLLALLWLEPMLVLFTDDQAVLAQAGDYARILFTGAPALWTMALLSSIYRGMGNMRFPALMMVFGAVIQIPLSGLLILGWFGMPSLGIAGAAWSIVTVACLNTLILIGGLCRARSPIRLRLDRFLLEFRLFGQILSVGLPSALSPVFTVIAIVAVNALVAEFGVAALAGYGIGSRVEFLLIPLVFGLGVSMNALVGVNLGAGRPGRALRIGWTGGFSAALLTGAVGIFMALTPETWAELFSDDPATLASAVAYLSIAGPFFAFQGLGLSLYFASQGAGRVAWPVVATFVRLLLAVGIAALAVHSFEAPLSFIYWCTGLGMLFYGLITAAAVQFGAWGPKN